mgnify:CR=1 FL=1
MITTKKKRRSSSRITNKKNNSLNSRKIMNMKNINKQTLIKFYKEKPIQDIMSKKYNINSKDFISGINKYLVDADIKQIVKTSSLKTPSELKENDIKTMFKDTIAKFKNENKTKTKKSSSKSKSFRRKSRKSRKSMTGGDPWVADLGRLVRRALGGTFYRGLELFVLFLVGLYILTFLLSELHYIMDPMAYARIVAPEDPDGYLMRRRGMVRHARIQGNIQNCETLDNFDKVGDSVFKNNDRGNGCNGCNGDEDPISMEPLDHENPKKYFRMKDTCHCIEKDNWQKMVGYNRGAPVVNPMSYKETKCT